TPAHSGHLIPTGAKTMQSVQIGRPQLEHVTAVSLRGLPEQTIVCVFSGVAIGVMVSARLPGNVRPMRVQVAVTPGEATRVPTGMGVDVLRATSTIVQALDAGYGAVYCCAEVEEAHALKEDLVDAVLGGERGGEPLPRFDLRHSSLEYLEPGAETLVLTTSNGTRAVVQTAENCDVILVGSMLNLQAVANAARERGEDLEVVCAGFRGRCCEQQPFFARPI